MQEGVYKNKYRIDSTRLNNWNYSQSGFYFVTICTRNLECVFGNVVCGGEDVNSRNNSRSENTEETRQGDSVCKINNREVGKRENYREERKRREPAETCRELVQTRQEGSSLQNDNKDSVFVKLLPIGKIVEQEWLRMIELRNEVELHDYVIMPNHFHAIVEIVNDKNIIKSVETSLGTSPPISAQNSKSTSNKIKHPKPKSLSIIINQFKGAVTRECNLNNYPFIWQSKFYDHVIRDHKDLNRIKRYIKNNPENWKSN